MSLDSSTLQDLQDKKSQVLYILKRHPFARNSDIYLQWIWLKYFGGLSVKLPYLPIDDFTDLGGGCLESVRRVRQKIQNEEKRYPPTDLEVKHMRQERSEAMRRVIKSV